MTYFYDVLIYYFTMKIKRLLMSTTKLYLLASVSNYEIIEKNVFFAPS